MFLLYYYRKYHLPPRAILAWHGLHCNKWDLGDDRAKFLNFSLLDNVSHLCFHLKVCCSTKMQCIGAKTSTSHLYWPSWCLHLCADPILGSQMFPNPHCTAGELRLDNSICYELLEICPTEQAGIVHYVRIIPLLLASSNSKVLCV